MKKMLAVSMTAVMMLCAAPAMAQSAQNSQNTKMADCNKQATGKTGDDRKAFMKTCLSNKPATAAKKLTPQQQKMGECNKQATGKTGDERKAFMKTCLSAG